MTTTVSRIAECRHCKWERPTLARGLCAPCYRNREVRCLFPKGNKHNPKPVEDAPEPTAEEVEAVITEQMKCLPWWWDQDCQLMRQREEEGKLDWFLVRLIRNANGIKKERQHQRHHHPL